jgi:hypothetical protein
MTTLYHAGPERWPQFTLRGPFVLVTLVALLMPWAKAEYRAWHCQSNLRELGRLLDVRHGGSYKWPRPAAPPRSTH